MPSKNKIVVSALLQSMPGRRGLLSSFNEIERRLRGFADTRYETIR